MISIMTFPRLNAIRLCSSNIQKWSVTPIKRDHSVEVKYNVPWGIIAGKLWGKQSKQPVIALHGLFDNAASFDKLLPLVDYPTLALDIPGYGRSSNPPPGLSPNYLDVVLWLRYLIKYNFKWDKVTFIGHSFGSNLAFSYSAIFPDEVDKYISIDCSRVNMAEKDEFIVSNFRTAYAGRLRKTQGFLLEGTYKEYLDHTISTRTKVNLPLAEEHYHLLLIRDLEEIGDNRYKSRVDWRPSLRYIGRPTLPFLEALSKQIKCEVLTIRASSGIIVDHRLKIYEKHLENIKKNSPKLVAEVVEGGHHVHLDNPKEVAKLINAFLTECSLDSEAEMKQSL